MSLSRPASWTSNSNWNIRQCWMVSTVPWNSNSTGNTLYCKRAKKTTEKPSQIQQRHLGGSKSVKPGLWDLFSHPRKWSSSRVPGANCVSGARWLRRDSSSGDLQGFVPSLGAQRWRIHLVPELQETQVQSPGQEDPLEKEMATHAGVLAWGIPWTEEPGGLQSTGSQRVGQDWATRHAGRALYFESHLVLLGVRVTGLASVFYQCISKLHIYLK